MKAPHLQAGQAAEQAARRWLERRGLRHLHSNYRCRYGELDLIMLEDQCLVFVEVRYRRGYGFGGALESITARKRAKVLLTAQHFLLCHSAHRNRPIRFDVIALSGGMANLHIDWRRRAFTANDC